MYQYTEFDSQFIRNRAAQHRDQLERYLAGTLSRRRVSPAAAAKRLVRSALRPMLRVAVPYGELNSAQLRVLATIARDYDRPRPELLAEAQAKQDEIGTTPGPPPAALV
jgi:sulfite reductase (NADPH) hemoprotein beta-component